MIHASNLTPEEYYKLNGTLTNSMIEELLDRYVNTDGYSAELILKPLGRAASSYTEDNFLDEAIIMADEHEDEELHNLLYEIRRYVKKRNQVGIAAIDEAIEQVWVP